MGKKLRTETIRMPENFGKAVRRTHSGNAEKAASAHLSGTEKAEKHRGKGDQRQGRGQTHFLNKICEKGEEKSGKE